MQSVEGSPTNQDNLSNAPGSLPNQNTYSDSASKTLKSLENLISESLQLYELENQIENTTDELVNSLRVITEYLGFSVNILPAIFELPANSNIILLPTLELIIRKSNGKTEQKRLDQFSTDIITKILEYIFPLVVSMIHNEKTFLTEKITFLRGATSRLNELQILKRTENVKQNVQLEGATNKNV